MRTALRKMGNSAGTIVPKPLLDQLGLACGATLDVRVEAGSIVLTPIRKVREGWEEDAARLGEPTEEERDWMAFGNEDDADLKW